MDKYIKGSTLLLLIMVSAMKRLLIVPLALMLVGYLASSCSSSASKDKEQNDSIAAAQCEAARLDSLRQDSLRRDSIEFYKFTSPDLIAFDLKGHVKEMKRVGNLMPSIIPIDGFTSVTFSYNGEVQFSAESWMRNASRNGNGFLTQGHDKNSSYYVEWNGNNIIRQSRKDEDGSYYEFSIPTYKDGRIVAYKSTTKRHGKIYSESDATIEYQDFDNYGNWISCVIKQTSRYPNGTFDRNYNRVPKEPTLEIDTLKREITYYTRTNYSDEEKEIKQRNAEFQKREEQEEALTKIPDWMQGTWHLDIDGPNGISVANYTITINGNSATLRDGSRTRYSGECHINGDKLYLGNSSSYDIRGQSLYYRYTRLTKEGSLSSWSGSFRTDSDVMRYLTDRTFYSESHRMSFTYNSCKIDGYAVSGAPRISNFSSTSATIVVNPLGGGRAVYLYLNASNGTINYEGDIFRAR